MAATLIVHYSNGYNHNFKDATKIHTASNLRRWAVALVKNQDIDGATLYVMEDDGTETPEYF